MRAPSCVYARDETLVLLFGAEVGEIALHDDRVGIERARSRRSRRVFITSGYGASPGSDVKIGPELLGRAEPAALDLAEMHVVDGRDRGERAGPAGAASVRDRRGQQIGRVRRRRPSSAYSRLGLEAGDPGRVVRAASS